MGSVSFALTLPTESDVHLTILDVMGRITSEHSVRYPAGRHQLTLPAVGMNGVRRQPGIYFARLELNGRHWTTRRFVIVK
jgi:hypothetical protein